MSSHIEPIRRLIIILGDQLDAQSTALEGIDPKQDVLWMTEAREESTHVPSSKPRTVMFLSAMRHFAQELLKRGFRVDYTNLDAPNHTGSLMGELVKTFDKYKAQEWVLAHPGDYRTLEDLKDLAKRYSISLKITPDLHFFTEPKDFEAFAKGRKQLRMEYWYRELRQRFNILMENGKPVGGEWNYDAENRKSFGKSGPSSVPKPFVARPDEITQEVISLVRRSFEDHVGAL
jgi:deoxyribodipyrimidine photolyase-related protein